MKRKKICFFIFGVGKGQGGHYHSLVTISETISKIHDVIIINLGYLHSPVVFQSKVKSYFVYFNGLNLWQSVKEIEKRFNMREFDCFHAYDYNSFLVVQELSKRYETPKVLTKCGGGNPKHYFPFTDYLVLFSEENVKFFKKNKKFKNTNIYFIPNRINSFSSNFNKIEKLEQKYKLSDKIVFLRICRISRFYKKSMIQSINLIEKLTPIFPNVALLIIGNNQDNFILEEMKEIALGKNVFFEIENEYTLNAKEVIDISDYVIGIGRGFMEAASKKKVLLTPSLNGEIPVLVNMDNFCYAFNKNFSERVDFPSDVINNNLNNIVNVVSSEEKYFEFKEIGVNWFKSYFSIEEVITKYIELYSIMKYSKPPILEFYKHWCYVIYNNLGTWYRNILK